MSLEANIQKDISIWSIKNTSLVFLQSGAIKPKTTLSWPRRWLGFSLCRSLIKEPEAAALYTIYSQVDLGLDQDDAIIICDCGGGTIDLISYEISNISPLELKELVPCKGGMFGSMMLNHAFENWIKDQVGDKMFSVIKDTPPYLRAVNQFDECIKRSFVSEDDDDDFIRFPGLGLQNCDNPKSVGDSIIISASDLNTLFAPIVSGIRELVLSQLNSVIIRRRLQRPGLSSTLCKPKAVFLVGGFGASIFLKNKLQAALGDIQVIQPERGWAAIVNGTVLAMMPQQVSVVSSVAQKHYGVRSAVPYDEKRGHKFSDRYWDEWDEIWKCIGMSWHIHKGEELPRHKVIELPFYRFVEDPDTDLLFTSRLYECLHENYPNHWDPDLVVKNCLLTADLTGIPKSMLSLRKRKSDG